MKDKIRRLLISKYKNNPTLSKKELYNETFETLIKTEFLSDDELGLISDHIWDRLKYYNPLEPINIAA